MLLLTVVQYVRYAGRATGVLEFWPWNFRVRIGLLVYVFATCSSYDALNLVMTHWCNGSIGQLDECVSTEEHAAQQPDHECVSTEEHAAQQPDHERKVENFYRCSAPSLRVITQSHAHLHDQRNKVEGKGLGDCSFITGVPSCTCKTHEADTVKSMLPV